jgi:hypothetical protein
VLSLGDTKDYERDWIWKQRASRAGISIYERFRRNDAANRWAVFAMAGTQLRLWEGREALKPGRALLPLYLRLCLVPRRVVSCVG